MGDHGRFYQREPAFPDTSWFGAFALVRGRLLGRVFECLEAEGDDEAATTKRALRIRSEAG
jgi:hypothetical protein